MKRDRKIQTDHRVTGYLAGLSILLIVITIYFGLIRKDTALAQNPSAAATGSNPEMASNNDGLMAKTEVKTEKRTLIREGTTYHGQHVVFRVTGSRVILTMVNGSERFFCLENLNLQRIAEVLRNNPTLTDWNVDYVITEYQGENYVLIHRAVLTSTALREKSLE